MISAKRMVQIFRNRGGGEFADLSQKLTLEQFAYLKQTAGGEPIIARLYSEEEWFVVTESRIIFRSALETRAISLDEIYWASTPKIDLENVEELRNFERIKTKGGVLAVALRDGTESRVRVEPGGPYFGLMNVLMRIGRITRGGTQDLVSVREPPSQQLTTSDQRRRYEKNPIFQIRSRSCG